MNRYIEQEKQRQIYEQLFTTSQLGEYMSYFTM